MTDIALLRDGYGNVDDRELERREWIDSLAYVLYESGSDRVRQLMDEMAGFASRNGVPVPFSGESAYVNTVPAEKEPEYPGDEELEETLERWMRWNAMAMVTKANRNSAGIGGHISTYQSVATLFEVGMNHFFRGRTADHPGDLVFFQGHASPGIYARAWMEGRLTEEHLGNFRRELADGGGLSSYPHPWLMPDFWQFPTVSMGLGPLMAVFQARVIRYLENRGFRKPTDQRVWAFLGDGEMDEPESLGQLGIASREKLDNLTFVVNCNLQRLDGPVRGNHKIIQELERQFRGSGWNVVKCIWGREWDPILSKDEFGVLRKRMMETVDGWYQKYVVESGGYFRDHFFGAYEEAKELVADLSDDQLKQLRRGGHDRRKVHAAYHAATSHKGVPTVVLAKSVKGYGLGKGGEAQNIAHNQKSLKNDEVGSFVERWQLNISQEDQDNLTFIKPADDSPEMNYLRERRQALGSHIPARVVDYERLPEIPESVIEEFYEGTGDREASTTMVFVRVLSKILKDKGVGKHIVPIVPDEARTFGMESLFRDVGIYASHGQQYDPVDKKSLLYYKEATDGQILQEGITEAGAMGDFNAAATSYANHGIPLVPLYTFYSMFGFQRVGDFIWANADARGRGFLMGATSGRTTLNGEGLQHEDGHSQLWAYAVPNLKSYDPAFAYEVGMLIRDGIKAMYTDDEEVFYYLTIANDNYLMPALPTHADKDVIREGVHNGAYLFKPSGLEKNWGRVGLLGSGPIMPQVQKAAEVLESQFKIAADIYSVTSYQQLYRDGVNAERDAMLDPTSEPRKPWITQTLEATAGDGTGIFVAASDYMKTLPESIARWVPGQLVSLGTDGFGRSESREALRDFFEVDWRHVCWAAIGALFRQGVLKPDMVDHARKELGITTDKPNPTIS